MNCYDPIESVDSLGIFQYSLSKKEKEVMSVQNVQGAIDHLQNHQQYPATKAQLVAECDNLSDFSEDDKKEFMEKLPEGTYQSADDVVQALGWS